MRPNWRNFIMLAAGILVVVALVVITSLQQQNSSTSTATTVATTLFSGVALTDVARLSVTDETSGTNTAYVQKPDGSWTIESTTTGGSGDITQTTVDTAIGNLIQVKAESFPADDLTVFGLDKPSTTVIFTTKDGKAQTLHIGNKNPQGNGYFALLNDDSATVHLLSGVGTITQLVTLASTPPFAVTPTPAATTLTMPGAILGAVTMQTVTKIELHNNTSDENIVYQKDAAGNWTIASATHATDAAVDTTQVTILINALAAISGVDGFESDDLAAYGLDKPLYTITLTTGPDTTMTINVGSTERNGTRTSIKVSGYTTIVVVKSEDLQPILDTIATPPYLAAEATAEATGEVTSEATTEATAEATQAATQEATAEVTAEATKSN